MSRTIIYNQAVLMANRINKQLREFATGDYSIDDVVTIHEALNQIEAILNSTVVVNKAPKAVEGLEVFETAVPTIIREARPKPSCGPRASLLDLPHETDRKRQF